MTTPDPLEEARKRVAGFLEEEGYYQDMLPGMEECEYGCMFMDHGIFKEGDDDEHGTQHG